MTKEDAIIQIQAIPEKIWNQISEYDQAALEMAFQSLKRETCNDCISRKDAVLMIQRYGVSCFDPDEFLPESEQSERFVISKLNELPSVNPLCWYKPNEKLPSEGENVIAVIDYFSCEYGTNRQAYKIVTYYDGHWYGLEGCLLEATILFWMPLPDLPDELLRK